MEHVRVGSRTAKITNAVTAAVVSAVTVAFLGHGYGAVPPPGPALEPGGGVWSWAADAKPTGSRDLRLAGMRAPATVAFDVAGVPVVHAASDHDLFRVQGYLQAYFRLTQLDLERRIARGRLAEIQGAAALDSDRFELQTGLLRTAEATWNATPPGSPEAEALTAFAAGVNDRLAELRRDGGWPSLFPLTAVYPRDWTPVDSLAIAELLAQMLGYSTAPLDYAILSQALGPQRAQAWFPVVPPNAQRPYDPGPYRYLGIAPLPAGANAALATPATTADRSGSPPAGPARTVPRQVTSAATDLLARISRLPASRMHAYPDSNAWAANGPAVAGGRAILAGDPHLQLSLPSFWYQMALSAPGIEVSGASLAGLPGVLIGRNSRISWSMTAVQNQSTLFYIEKTRPGHPDQYAWRGGWRTMQRVQYTIPVRGGADVPVTVDLTVHGPVMSNAGKTTSVWWAGNYPSHTLSAILGIDKARDYTEFRSALRDWHAPTLNFAYADGQGNIAVGAAGYFPLVKAGQPWLPLPGTGEYDVAGVIPYDAVPQVYNPPGHVVVTANQRPVTAAYPYYIGTSLDDFDNGYRAGRISDVLDGRRGLTAGDFAALQNDVTDQLATLIVPRLLTALRTAPLDPVQRAAFDELARWDNRMTESSTGATIWWTFWTDYLAGVFQPWWDASHVPVGTDSQILDVAPARASLDEDLEAWTLRDPGNPAFSPPGRPPGTATSAMRDAFQHTLADLTGRLGRDPAAWRWGRVHTREIPALTGASGLGYGPLPAGGDRWTVNAAEGGMRSTFGPSWRMVVTWTGPATATAAAIYPGGQSENPASPWYRNLVVDWWNGRLRGMPWVDDPAPGSVVWTLRATR
ncbi:MAG TPA: penicillin acylase family protein [Actinoplanes sp.]